MEYLADDQPLRLHGRVANVVGSDKVASFVPQWLLEESLAVSEHAVDKVLGDTMVLEVEETDVL